MKVSRLSIPEVVELTPTRYVDERGYFSEIFRRASFRDMVASVDFVQENQSLSSAPGTIRGLHYQRGAFAQGKLVRCTAGAIFDVAVDVRPGSATYGRWVTATLTPEQGNQLWIPTGFLHGFCTLEPNSVVCYKVTNYYSSEHDAGVKWNDPTIGIEWPAIADLKLLSEKDAHQPQLEDADTRMEQEI